MVLGFTSKFVDIVLRWGVRNSFLRGVFVLFMLDVVVCFLEFGFGFVGDLECIIVSWIAIIRMMKRRLFVLRYRFFRIVGYRFLGVKFLFILFII